MSLPTGPDDRIAADAAGAVRWPAVPLLLVACVGVLVAMVFAGALRPWPAVAAAGAIVAAALLIGWLPGAAAGGRRTPAEAVAPRPPDQPALADVVAALPLPAVVLDAESIVIAANAAALELAPALRRGAPALLVLRLPAIVEAVRNALATGAPQRAEFSERVPIDRWYEAHVVPIAGTAGGPGSVLLLTFHDLTPLRLVEQTRADFVANASHELRTPLAALSGFIDTLQGPARNDAAAREEFLGIMKEQARRMARLIDDLLSLSRIELNEHIPPQRPVDLTAAVRQVADGLQMLARERGVTVTVAAPDDALIVPGDRDELIRVFENLVENALKYGGDGGRIEVTVRAAGGNGMAREAEVTVRDYGPGIAPEHLPRLTERFYRVDVGRSRAEGGTGLGLALVKHIVTRHRGRLAIDSAPGKGSAFTVSLPLHRPKG